MPKQSPKSLQGRTMLVPNMSTVGSRCLAAALSSLGINAVMSPPTDDRTLELAARYTTGDECLPQRVVLGNFLKQMAEPGFDPSKLALFIPTSSGPCRFGQYAPLIKKILREMGNEEVLVFSPTSSDQYESIAGNTIRFKRTAWRVVVTSDILRKLVYMYRPYEKNPGDADRIQTKHLDAVCEVFKNGGLSLSKQLRLLTGHLEAARDDFSKMPLKEPLKSRPLIGVVGEIFLRFNSVANQQLIRHVEAHGGECWIADISEWIWYTNAERERKLRDKKRSFSAEMLQVKIRDWVQHHDENKLLAPFNELFKDRKEPPVKDVLKNSEPYLPARKALGEMTLNTGKAISFYQAGCDGVIDISPFTCMNGIVTEAVYPTVSRDHDGIPIRIFYFDGVPVELDRDLDIFMELVLSYRKKRLRLSSHSNALSI